jgi:hypothetical protein
MDVFLKQLVFSETPRDKMPPLHLFPMTLNATRYTSNEITFCQSSLYSDHSLHEDSRVIY